MRQERLPCGAHPGGIGPAAHKCNLDDTRAPSASTPRSAQSSASQCKAATAHRTVPCLDVHCSRLDACHAKDRVDRVRELLGSLREQQLQFEAPRAEFFKPGFIKSETPRPSPAVREASPLREMARRRTSSVCPSAESDREILPCTPRSSRRPGRERSGERCPNGWERGSRAPPDGRTRSRMSRSPSRPTACDVSSDGLGCHQIGTWSSSGSTTTVAPSSSPSSQGSPLCALRAPSRSVSPISHSTSHTARHLFQGNCELVEDLLYESLPPENIAELTVRPLRNEGSMQRFLHVLHLDGGRWSRVRITWHLAGGVEAAKSIMEVGICCDEAHCSTGRYGRGGYVALTAAKANAYAAGEDLRRLFVVLSLPEDGVLQGERGTRPSRTAADLPRHPTEFCFVDTSRLHCVCLVTYRWVSTERREKWARARSSMKQSPRRCKP